MTILKQIKTFLSGVIFAALVVSVCMNVWLWRSAQDGMGYTPSQRAQMEALLAGIEGAQ